jgi:hypothetical protein
MYLGAARPNEALRLTGAVGVRLSAWLAAYDGQTHLARTLSALS